MFKHRNFSKNLPYPKSIQIILLIILVLAACGNKRRPGLSDKELFAQRKVDALQEPEQEPDFSDMENYVIPSGIKYKESRAVDPAQPPVVIDIEMALQRGTEDIPLSSIGKSVRYIKANIPKDMFFGDFVIRDDTLFVSCRDAIANQCIFPYTLDGKFMNFIWEIKPNGIVKKEYPDIEEEAMPPQTATRTPPTPSLPPWSQGDEIIFYVDFDHTGKEIHYTITRWQDRDHPDYHKHIISRLSGARRAVRSNRFEDQLTNTYYQPDIGWIRVCRTLDVWFQKSPWSLITFSARGDTLCRFANHNPVTPVNLSSGQDKERNSAYTFNDLLTFRTDYADTIFRVVAPDRILPVYAINSGKYKLYAVEGLRGQTDNKVYIENIFETQRFLFVAINTPSREKQALVYDKQRQTLRLNRGEKFSNDIAHGPDFYPEKMMPDGKTMVCCYPSTYFQNNPSNSISNLFPSMAKNSIVFMILQ